ncbi:MAG TPA: hypothetical protein VMO88_03220, partial [Acidimicrobiales bacterium]|nr:hypothetical protein [Acidimicrobiales bacterium]
VEYAKAAPEDVLIRITVTNRGSDAAPLRVLPTLWFRNTWTGSATAKRPEMRQVDSPAGTHAVLAQHVDLGDRWLCVESEAPLLFTDNTTNTQRLFDKPNAVPYVKDGINDFVVKGNKQAVNPEAIGTKVAADVSYLVAPGKTEILRLRLTNSAPGIGTFFGFDAIFEQRLKEADAFYATLTPPKATKDEARVMRQALAGMLWSKQYFLFDVDQWLREHGCDPLSPSLGNQRNRDWGHMTNDDVISMPDKWEYPWYAAWDLAFQCLPLSMVDIDFAKDQLELMLRETSQHPNGQIPAYEWNFSDVNPPVHAWATLAVYRREQAMRGVEDVAFLKRSFGKLVANFTWWVNRKDRLGRNIFEGGFLGLDNIGVFDRSSTLPTGGYLEQADGTAWMALFSQNMLELAIEIATHDPSYDPFAAKFLDHLLWIGHAINRMGMDGLWDEEDGFYYDVLRTPDGRATRLKVRSVVGLLPMCATTILEPRELESIPRTMKAFEMRRRRMPELFTHIYEGRGYGDRGLMALVNPKRLKRILSRMLDEKEFLGAHGIRALSRDHEQHPYVFKLDDLEYRVKYVPGDSDSGMFGGNSNWRGPVWMPINALIIRALVSFYCFYGNDFTVECPTGSGRQMNLYEVARDIATRLKSAFLVDSNGRRPIHGNREKFQKDPHWKDHLIFPEYFHGDTGAAVGASHQTGWTGVVAYLMEIFGRLSAAETLERGKHALFPEPEAKVKRSQ